MEIEIIKTESSENIEKVDAYRENIYHAPLVTLWKDIDYTVNGVELSVSIYMGSGRLPIFGQTVKGWCKDNNKEFNAESIQEALEDTKKQRVRLSRGVDSSTKFVYTGKKSNNIAYKSFLMADERFDDGHRNHFVINLDKKRGVCIDKYAYAYLYRHTGTTIKYELEEEVCIDKKIRENLAWRLHETILDIKNDYRVSTVDEILDYQERIFEEYGIKPDKKLMKNIVSSHNVFKAMDTYDIYEALQIISDDLEEKTTLYEINSLK
jgi:hypothetical protein